MSSKLGGKTGREIGGLRLLSNEIKSSWLSIISEMIQSVSVEI